VATVRQSITALYEESRRSAVDGAPLMAVIDTVPAADAATMPPPATPRPAIVARFDELRRLAEIEAGGRGDTAGPASDREGDPIPAIDAGLAPPSFGTRTILPEDDAETGLSAAEQAEADSEALPAAAAASRRPAAPTSAAPALPEEPPAPASTSTSGAADDLDIGDIQELVRQAWEDEAGIGHAARQDAPPDQVQDEKSDGTTFTNDPPPAPADIEMAMEEIAAAVVQSGDGTAPVDVEAMKTEIVSAMRTEMKALLEADLTNTVRAAVAEAVNEAMTRALAEVPPAASAPAAKPAAKKAAVKKAAAKASAARKSPAKKPATRTAAKTAAAKKTAPVKKLRADPTPDPDEA